MTVNADTGRLTAQLVKGGRTAGQAGADAISGELGNLDTKKLNAQLKLIKKKIEAELSQIQADIGLDDSELQADLKRLQARLRAAQLEVQVGAVIDDPEVKAKLEALRTTIGLMRGDVKAGVGIDESELVALEAEIQATFDLMDVTLMIQVEADEAAFAAAIAEIEAAVGDIEALITPNVSQADLEVVKLFMEEQLDNVQALIELGVQPGEVAFIREYLELRLRDIQADIEANVDEASVASALARLRAVFSSGGEDAGGEFGAGVGKGLSTRTKLLAESIAVLLEPLFVVVQDLAAAFTAVLGSAINGLVSGVGAAAPVIAGLGAVMTAAVTGAQGFGAAMTAVNEEMAAAVKEGRAFDPAAQGIAESLAGLAPSAQDAARAFGEVRTQLGDVQAVIQDRLFEDLDSTIRSLASTALPSMGAALADAAGEANLFAKDLAEVANNTDFAGLFDSLQPAVRAVHEAVIDLVATIEPFLLAAAPAGERLADAFARSAQGLRAMVENNPQGITDFLDRGLESLSAWWELIRNVGDALGTIFAAGQSQGDTFVRTLADLVARWDQWLESVAGQDALQEFFNGAAQTISALSPIVEALGEAFTTIVTPESRERLEGFADAIAAAVPVLAEIIVLIGRLQIGEAFGTVLAVLGPIVDVLGMLPDGLLEVIGLMKVLATTMNIVKAAAIGLASIPGPILAITAALAAAKIAYDVFTAAERETDAVTKAVTASLRSSVDAIVSTGDAAKAATAGVDALNKSLVGSGDEGDKLQSSLSALGLSADDATSMLVKLGEDPVDALTKLGEAQGLSAEESRNLAKAINENDENVFAYAAGMTSLADNTSLTTEEQIALVKAMEELQDQAEKTDLQAIAQEHIVLAAGADKASQALLSQAEANTGVKRTAADVLPLYEEFTRLQVEAAAATKENTDALGAQSAARGAGAAFAREQAAANVAAGEAARAAAADENRLARDTDNAIRAAAEQVGISGDTAIALQGLGDGARAAADEAKALSSALDLLLAPQLGAQAATDALQQNLADLAEAAMETAITLDGDAVPAVDRFALATSNLSGIGRDNREIIRSNIEGILEYAGAALEAGVANDTVAANVASATAALRDQLITGFGATKEEADAYIATLLGVPGLVETVITQPGVLEALVNGEELNVTYDEAGNPVITEFSAPNLSKVAGAAEDYQANLTGIDQTDPESTFSANYPDSIRQAERIQEVYNGVDDTNPDSRFTQPGIDIALADTAELQLLEDSIDETDPDSRFTMTGLAKAITDTEELQVALDDIETTDPSPNITLPGITSRIQEVNDLKAAIDRLQSRTVTITTVNRNVVQGGSMAGELITGPTVRNVGERGYREAIIPLDLPLNRVDPSVRALAAMIRGHGPAPAPTTAPVTSLAPPQIIHNHEWNITDSGDPEATAHRVMNRLVGSL